MASIGWTLAGTGMVPPSVSAISWLSGAERCPSPSGVRGAGDRAEPARQARVLVVEDESLVAMMVTDMLEDLGHAVCGVAATAEEAVALAGRLRPDLVLMDVNLAGPRDGVAAAAAIRAQQETHLVYVTAFSDPASRARMEGTRPDAIVTKPYAQAELARVLAHVLGAGGPE